MTRAVLLNSGGIDSRVCAAMMAEHGWEMHSLFLDWNPRLRPAGHEASQKTADLYCASHAVLTYSLDLTAWNKPTRKMTANYASMTSTMIGMQYAVKVDADWVVNGTRAETGLDVRLLNEAINSNRIQENRMAVFPVYDLKDAEVMERAKSLGVELSTTWSCSEYPACGTCAACEKRRRQGL